MNEIKSKYSDQQIIIEQIINRNSKAVEAILPKLRSNLKFFLFKQNKLNSENLRDLVNETFAAAFQSRVPQLECNAVHYLTKIGKNLWFLKRRRNKEIPVPTQYLDSLPGVDAIMEYTREDLYILNLAKSKLSERSQKILEFYSLNYDPEIIAERLGFSDKKTYHSRKYECFVELRKHFDRLMRLTKNKYQ